MDITATPVRTIRCHDLDYVYTGTEADENTGVEEIQVPLYEFNGMERLSLTQVAIMVTLLRATQVEDEIIREMETVAENNKKLEKLNGCADRLSQVTRDNVASYNPYDQTVTYHDGFDASGNPVVASKTVSQLMAEFGIAFSSGYDGCMAAYQAVKKQMENLNSLNQENMIQLQSLVNKRDQAYELGSNIDRLFASGFMTVARNI